MSKEYLEALDWLEEKCYVESPQAEKFEECCKIIRQALQRLESIDNANPSEALGLVKRTCEIYMETTRFLKGSDIVANQIKEALNTIKQALIKAEKEHKALEIIKEKDCDMRWLKFCIKGNAEAETYNNGLSTYYEELTEEEFILLKEMLE